MKCGIITNSKKSNIWSLPNCSLKSLHKKKKMLQSIFNPFLSFTLKVSKYFQLTHKYHKRESKIKTSFCISSKYHFTLCVKSVFVVCINSTPFWVGHSCSSSRQGAKPFLVFKITPGSLADDVARVDALSTPRRSRRFFTARPKKKRLFLHRK